MKLNRLLVIATTIFAILIVGNTISAKNYELTFSEAAGPDHIITQFDKRFAEYVEEETKGQIKVNVVPGGLFGTYESMLEQVQQGTVAFCIIGSSISGDVVPQVMITLVPFLYKTEEEVNFITQQKEIMGPIEAEFYKKGVKIVTWSFASLRNTLTKSKPLNSKDDFKGLKIRAPGRPILLAMKDLGANPIPMPFAEIYTAMQTGMVDAVERNTFVMKQEGWEKTIGYLNMDGHSGDALAIAMNKKLWEELTSELKDAVTRAGKRAHKWAYDYNLKANEEIKEFYPKHGIKIINYSKAQQDQFYEATGNARKILIGEIGEDLANMAIEKLKAYRAK
jgi:tripartite ATP-independent transporter DctP family solute receptor